MNLLELQNKARQTQMDLHGANQLVQWTKSQAGWLLIYERVDEAFIKLNADDNFQSYALECQQLADAAKVALMEGIKQAKKAQAKK